MITKNITNLRQVIAEMTIKSLLLPVETKKEILNQIPRLGLQQLNKILFALQKEKNIEEKLFSQVLEKDLSFFEKLKHNIFSQFQRKRNEKEKKDRQKEEDVLLSLENEIANIFS